MAITRLFANFLIPNFMRSGKAGLAQPGRRKFLTRSPEFRGAPLTVISRAFYGFRLISAQPESESNR